MQTNPLIWDSISSPRRGLASGHDLSEGGVHRVREKHLPSISRRTHTSQPPKASAQPLSLSSGWGQPPKEDSEACLAHQEAPGRQHTPSTPTMRGPGTAVRLEFRIICAVEMPWSIPVYKSLWENRKSICPFSEEMGFSSHQTF